MEAEEFDKENRRVAEECEMKGIENAAESLLLLKDPRKVHAETQSETKEWKTMGSQCSSFASSCAPSICILEARSPLTDECIKCYTGLLSCAVFNHLATF